MKLRLETGNFKITGSIDNESHAVTVNNLPKGLSPEDFLGCVMDFGTVLLVVTDVMVDPGDEATVTFGAGNMVLAYDRLTGEVVMSEGGSEG